MFQEIDRSLIESCAGGYDSRPFESKLYLAAPFNEEYLAALKSSAVNENAVTNAKLPAAPETSATLDSLEEKNWIKIWDGCYDESGLELRFF